TFCGRAARHRRPHAPAARPAAGQSPAPCTTAEKRRPPRCPRVSLADGDGEVFEETPRGPLPCPGDERRQVWFHGGCRRHEHSYLHSTRLSRTSFRSRLPCNTATTCNGTV